MFDQMLLPEGGSHQGRNTLVAFAGQLGVVTIAIGLMAYFDVVPFPFPQPAIPLVLSAPPPPPPPATATHAPIQKAVNKFVPRIFSVPVPTAPALIPQAAAIIADAAPALPDIGGEGVIGGVPGGILGGQLNGVVNAFPPPPVAAAPPKPAPATPTEVRVGGEVQAALLKHEVVPVYPPIARAARVQGTVRLSASIAPDGRVKDLQVLDGNPLLVTSAEAAVKQWTYQPTYLNGKPVEVLTEIDVKFTLG
jgi:periplasmic protein TonB